MTRHNSSVPLVTLIAAIALVAECMPKALAQNYTCTQETGTNKCLTVNSKNSWIVGEIRQFAFGGDAKSRIVTELHKAGWVECEGQVLSIKDFPDLYRAVGTTWGSKDPANSFLTPDLRGMFLRGWYHGGSQKNPDGSVRDPQFTADTSGRVPPRAQSDVGTGGLQGNNQDSVGSMQPSAFQTHIHSIKQGYANIGAGGAQGAYTVPQQPPNDHVDTSEPQNLPSKPVNVSPSETRPMNAYVMYFIFVGADVSNVDPTTGRSLR